MRRARGESSAGQALIMFALFATVIVGVIALAVDVGFASNLRRNLQAFSDNAAVAGASQLGPNPGLMEQMKARKTAFIVLRDSLGMQLCGAAAGCGANPEATCSGVPIDFTSDVVNCRLQSPYDNYAVSFQAHAGLIPSPINQLQGATLSVQVNDNITSALGGVIGQSTIAAGVVSVASYETVHPFGVALFADHQVQFDDKLETIYGDVYSNGNGVVSGSFNRGHLCTARGSGGFGNLIYDSGMTFNGSWTQGSLTALQCRGSSDGNLSAMGSFVNAFTDLGPPAYTPPPNIPVSAGVANQPCDNVRPTSPEGNGTHSSAGTDPRNCFSPGVYTTLTGVANNLNPGIYVITGDGTGAGVQFSGDTANLNYADVADKCWTKPLVGASPCPDGVVTDPTSSTNITDPQCSGSGTSALAKPTLAAPTALVTGGSFPAGTYFTQVTQTNGLGETQPSNEVAATVLVNGAMTLTLPANGTFNVYGPSLTSGKEVLNANFTGVVSGVLGTTITITAPQAATGASLPLFNTTSCNAGFNNVPSRSDQNHGVTFILQNDAEMRVGTAGSTEGIIVMLSPFCGGTCPASPSGSSINDGKFVVYGPQGQGQVVVEDQGADTPGSPASVLAMTGEVYLPLGSLVADEGDIQLIPGQAVVRDAMFDCAGSAGHICPPSIYWDGQHGGLIAAGVRLIQ